MGYGKLRDISTIGDNPAVPETLDQHTKGTARIEHTAGCEGSDHLVGDLAEHAKPMIISRVRHRTAMRTVVTGVVGV